jgi:hypothetical protein
MLPALRKSEIGQNFRRKSEDMTAFCLCDRGPARVQVFLTPDRYSYFRFTQPSDSERTGRIPHTLRTYRELIPWAAVSRSVVAPKARAERPAPLPFWKQVEAS